MHLAYVTAALPFTHEEAYITPEIQEARKQGHRVTVFPVRPRGEVIHDDARPLVPLTVAEPLFSFSVAMQALGSAAGAPAMTLRSMRLLAGSRSPAVLLKNLAVLPKGLCLARIALQRRVDHIHAHFASTSATAALVASTVSGIPFSFTAHRWDITENNLLREKVQAARFARAIDAAGGLDVRGYAPGQGGKVKVIHMGVSVPSLGARPKRAEGAMRVLLAARFDRRKGHRYALEAVARLKTFRVDVSLDCVGVGPTKARMETLADLLDVSDRVRFPGELNHQDLLVRLVDGRWDVALLPSIETGDDKEGIPVFLIEAMAAGIPVVSTQTGGIPELLHGGAGLLVPQRSSDAIADALAMLATNGSVRRRLADAGTQRVRDCYSIEVSVSTLLDQIGTCEDRTS